MSIMTNQDKGIPTYLSKLRLNGGGYDSRGRYFENVRGTCVYRYDFSGDIDSGFVRAKDREHAKEEVRKLYEHSIRFKR
jgi:hypothetical protein